MAWIYLFGLGIVLWGSCGAVMAIGRKLWSLDTTLRVHLAAAPLLAFVISLIHRSIAPTFNALLRAVVLTALIIALDAGVVAPVFERSHAMFRSLVGTWLPFAAIFLGSLAAGILVTA
jgi:hypothetical protein